MKQFNGCRDELAAQGVHGSVISGVYSIPLIQKLDWLMAQACSYATSPDPEYQAAAATFKTPILEISEILRAASVAAAIAASTFSEASLDPVAFTEQTPVIAPEPEQATQPETPTIRKARARG